MDSRRTKKDRSTDQSPNRKYRKNRTCNYESKAPHYLPAPEIISLESKNGPGKVPSDSPKKGEKTPDDLISEKIFSLLRESPDRVSEKVWKKRASSIGINTYNRDRSKKRLSVLLDNFKTAAEYLNEAEGFEEERVFKISTIKEFAEILEIKTEDRKKEELYDEILESMNIFKD